VSGHLTDDMGIMGDASGAGDTRTNHRSWRWHRGRGCGR
jgi:hypothetical protein